MGKWKRRFDNLGSDIWTHIEEAITYAAVYHYQELRERRDSIAEKLFAPPNYLDHTLNEHDQDGSQSKEDKQDLMSGSDGENNNLIACSYEEAQALSDEMEEESRQMKEQIKEISRIREHISDPKQREEDLLNFLQRLEEMHISYDSLKTTDIEHPVSNLLRHSSKRVQSLAKRVLRSWKILAEEWTKCIEDVTVAAAARGSLEDGCGLPSPPLDEGDLLLAQTTPLEMTKMFDLDFIDDDINAETAEIDNHNAPSHSSAEWAMSSDSDYDEAPKKNNDDSDHDAPRRGNVNMSSKVFAEEPKKNVIKSGAMDKIRERAQDSRQQRLEKKDMEDGMGRKSSTDNSNRKKDTEMRKLKCDKPAAKPNSLPAKPLHGVAQSRLKKSNDYETSKLVNKDRASTSRPTMTSNEDSVERLAAVKRKLQEGYQQAEKAKKQRSMQVMELQDLPKGGPRARSSGAKLNTQSHNRQWSGNRR